MDNGMSLSDIAAVTGGKNDGFLDGRYSNNRIQ